MNLFNIKLEIIINDELYKKKYIDELTYLKVNDKLLSLLNNFGRD